jgi:hypothetical protein
MKILDLLLSPNDARRRLTSVGITAIIAGLLSLWGIYVIEDYGIALFILTPFFMGAGSTLLFGYKREITRQEGLQVGFLTLGVFSAGLLIFAVEGLICLVMALPFGVMLMWFGSLVGVSINNHYSKSTPTALLLFIGIIPAMAFIEKDLEPKLSSVVSSIEIDANPQTVWKNVVEFPELGKPSEFLFQTGIAYPINAKIEGTGVGAVRHCNFTTGSFVEPITVWDEPNLLAFDVLEQPAPMKELSFWDVDAPHLHDYFVSKRGQFKLTALPDGKTLLEGTTWYYHNIKPAFYWQLWSDYIVHKIHNRVLTHIKTTSEKAN